MGRQLDTMLNLQTKRWDNTPVKAPASPLQAIWCGKVTRPFPLPQLGHLFLLFPLAETAVSCAGTTIRADQYVWLTQPPAARSYTVAPGLAAAPPSQLLLLMLSPGFIADMADFLSIPPQIGPLLHAIPLAQGDWLSGLLQTTAELTHGAQARDALDELLLEVVGHVLQMMRVRHQALARLSHRKRQTVADLLPRLLQARQFIEAHSTQPLKTQDVAAQAALSEAYFARLFKTAFDVTVHQYLLQHRLERARSLLAQPDTSVTAVAYDVGYRSLSAFIHAFRRRFGVTPSAVQPSK